MMSRTDETHALAVETPSTGVTTPLQQGDQQGSHPVEVSVKAKPPTPPDWGQQKQRPPLDQPSRNSQRSPLTREQRSSRRSRSRRRPTHHRRDLSPRTHRKETERRPTKTRSSLDKYPQRVDRPSATSRTPRSEPNDGRRRDHPIYQRANEFRQVHQDATSTVYSKAIKDKNKPTLGCNSQRSRKESNITLKSRSRSRKSKKNLHPWLSLIDPQVYYLLPKLDQTDLKAMRTQLLETPQFQKHLNPIWLTFPLLLMGKR